MQHQTSAGGVILYNNKVLTIAWHDGYICFPKGHIDPGETSKQAAVREVFEETGYRAEIISFIGSSTYERPEASPPYRKTVDYYLMEITDDSNPTPHREPGENFENLWLTPSEALQQLSYEDAKQLLRRALTLATSKDNAK